MSEERHKSGSWIWWVPILLPFLYLLNIGPMYGAASRHYVSWDFYVVYSRPTYVFTGCRPIRVTINRYCELCNPQ